MADSVNKVKQWHQQSHVYTFLQFAVILLVVIFLILVSSASFYESMIENITAFTLQNSAQILEDFDYNTIDTVEIIQKLETEKSVYIEIYTKANVQDKDYRKNVYRRTDPCTSFDGKFFHRHSVPLLNFNYSKFTSPSYEYPLRSLGENTNAGRFDNQNTQTEYYVLCTVRNDYLFVVAKPFAVISAQATAVKYSAIFISCVIFVLIAVISYLFITRVTRPLKDIREVTSAMAETNYSTLRIPTRETNILTDTDETIASVNYLYERLILTQEGLREKTEFLANQLAQRDIEQKAREEFIASTSHELKTPIAIIQGYAEGAKYMTNDPEALNEYCDTIIDECVRMNDLVVKMMALSKLKQTRTVVFDDFSIKDFVEERLKLHEKLFEKNDIRAENLITDNIIGKADKEKLQFVINNLLSNAVSYIGGERIIRVRYEDMDSVYRIFVYNTGDPIPQNDLEMLWESFYRNDPARNRNEGHFGLGLSIVKSVQDAHSQSCGVDNADGGVEFWFDVLKG